LLIWVFIFAVLPLTLAAQGQATPTPTLTALPGFEKMSETAPREVLPATPLVFFAYAFVWLALVVYVFSIWRRMGRVEQDLAAVQQRLREGSGGR
jgi:CcmD family protein